MNENDLKRLVKDFTKKMNESPPNYNLFKTVHGKNFQTEMEDLMDTIDLINILPSLPDVATFMIEGLENIDGMDKDDKNIIGLDEEIELIVKKQDKIISIKKTTLKELLDSIKNPITSNGEDSEFLSKSIHRVNSYYFLALFAYLDQYVNSILQDILTKYRAKHCIEFFDEFRRNREPKFILEKIRNKLEKGNIEKITILPEGKPWHVSFNTMLNLRHKFAHKQPKARRELLDEKFERISNDFSIDSKKIFDKYLQSQFLSDKLILRYYNAIKPHFETLLILKQIGKECIGYLALYDHIIADFFKKYKPI